MSQNPDEFQRHTRSYTRKQEELKLLSEKTEKHCEEQSDVVPCTSKSQSVKKSDERKVRFVEVDKETGAEKQYVKKSTSGKKGKITWSVKEKFEGDTKEGQCGKHTYQVSVNKQKLSPKRKRSSSESDTSPRTVNPNKIAHFDLSFLDPDVAARLKKQFENTVQGGDKSLEGRESQGEKSSTPISDTEVERESLTRKFENSDDNITKWFDENLPDSTEKLKLSSSASAAEIKKDERTHLCSDTEDVLKPIVDDVSEFREYFSTLQKQESDDDVQEHVLGENKYFDEFSLLDNGNENDNEQKEFEDVEEELINDGVSENSDTQIETELDDVVDEIVVHPAENQGEQEIVENILNTHVDEQLNSDAEENVDDVINVHDDIVEVDGEEFQIIEELNLDDDEYIIYINSDNSDDDTMDTGLAPSPFHGRHLENADEHVANVNLYLATRKLPAAPVPPVQGDQVQQAPPPPVRVDDRNMAQIAYFANSLKDSASTWFHSLTIGVQPGEVGTFDALIAAFRERFQFDQANQWREIGRLSRLKQKSDQLTEDYIREVQDEGRMIRANDNQVRTTILNGLRPEIQNAVLNHEIGENGLQEIRRWALVAEASLPMLTTTNPEISKLTTKVEEMMKKLEKNELRVRNPVETATTSPASKAAKFNDDYNRRSAERETSRSPERTNTERTNTSQWDSTRREPRSQDGGYTVYNRGYQQRGRGGYRGYGQPGVQGGGDNEYSSAGAQGGHQGTQWRTNSGGPGGYQQSYRGGGQQSWGNRSAGVPGRGYTPYSQQETSGNQSWGRGTSGPFFRPRMTFNQSTSNFSRGPRPYTPRPYAQTSQGPWSSSNANNNTGGCSRCNSSVPCETWSCPARGKQCLNCGKMDHFAARCRSRSSNPQ